MSSVDRSGGVASVPGQRGAGWPRWSGIGLVAAMLAAFLAVGAVGAAEAARGERVLPLFDPLADWFRKVAPDGIRWLLANGGYVGWATAATAGVIAGLGLVVGGRRAAPLVLLAAAVLLAAWGQILLLKDRTALGVWLYGCGVVCAVVLGGWCPMSRLDGFPELPLPTRRRRRRASDEPEAVARAEAAVLPAASAVSCRYPPWKWEWALIFSLTVTALFTRTYALTEMPHFFDLEMIISMIESRSLYGLRSYIASGLLANNTGMMHFFPKTILFDMFGVSIYTLRLSGVLFGVAAIPLMYWLVRRIAGVGPAVVATLLIIAEPEQLFWSRTENTYFAPLATAALVSAHLGLWMVQRFSLGSVLAAAIWMPFCRFLYTAGVVIFAYPLVLFGHALLCVRGAWRKAWYVAPILGGGLALWIFSFSIVCASVANWKWSFKDPVNIYGAPAWTRLGAFRDASWPQLVRLQAGSMAENLGVAVKNMTYSVPGYSHWCERADLSPTHKTTVNVGLAVISALGLGYLLGQIHDRRGFALLAWVGLALLPGIMSDEPADRRITLVFPALDAVAAVMLGVIVRLVRSRTGVPLARFATGMLSVAVAGVIGTSLASYFLLPIGPTWMDGPIRFAKPLFEQSDAIFHNVDIYTGLVFGNLDSFLTPGRTPGIQMVDSKSWLQVALHPRCTFADPVYSAAMPAERVAALRAAYDPKRVSFLLQDLPYSHAQIELLRELFPSAQVREYQPPSGQIGNRLVAITTSISDIKALGIPALRVGVEEQNPQTLATRLLEGVRLETSKATAGDGAGQGVVIQGGFLLEREGWYRFALAPPCAEATFTIDDRPAPSAEVAPLTAGVHPFEITLPTSTSCALPLSIMMQAHGEKEMRVVTSDSVVGPAVASLPAARGAAAVPYDGYGEARPFGALQGTPLDFGIDAQGYANVLVRDAAGTLRVHRLAPDGHVEAAWQPQVTGGPVLSMAVDRSGVSALMGSEAIALADRAGKPVSSWTDPTTWTTQMTFWGPDRILKAMQFHNSIALLNRNGQMLLEWSLFQGGPGKFEQPVTVAVGPQGYLLVLQADGQALLFQNPGDEWAPVFVRSFQVDFSQLPVGPQPCVFDGPDRIVIANNPATAMLVYNLDGERMMAANPVRDLNAKGFGEIARVQSYEGELYVLDRAGKLWSVPR